MFVGNRFHLKPLLPLVEDHYQFYIVTLSQNEVRLFRSTRQSIREVPLEGCPGSLAQALKDEEPDKQLQYHTFATSGGQRIAVFHGQGARVDAKKGQIIRFFRQVDTALQNMLRDQHAPLILAAADHLLPLYREVNSYPYLTKEGIAGNPERTSANDLRRLGWRIVEPDFQKPQREAATRYHQLAGSTHASSDIRQIVRAAYQGQVEVMFVPVMVQHWGKFDPVGDKVELHEDMLTGDDDLVDLAACYTLMKGGTAYPVESALASIFRH